MLSFLGLTLDVDCTSFLASIVSGASSTQIVQNVDQGEDVRIWNEVIGIKYGRVALN